MPAAIHRSEVVIATVRVSNIEPSTCCDSEGALDCYCEIRIEGRDYAGELTLCPRAHDGRYDSWGSPDMWVSGRLLAALRDLPDDQYRMALDCIAVEAGGECDDWKAQEDT